MDYFIVYHISQVVTIALFPGHRSLTPLVFASIRPFLFTRGGGRGGGRTANIGLHTIPSICLVCIGSFSYIVN